MKPFRAARSLLPLNLPAAAIAGLLTLGFAGAAAAQNEPNVAVVDVARIFKDYRRTVELDAKIDEARNTYETQLDERAETHHRLVEDIARIDKALDNPALDDLARAERQQDRAKDVEQSRQLEHETAEFKAARERGIQEMTTRARTQIVEDILMVLKARVETRHYDLILNRSAKGVGQRSAVLYANDKLDITDDVLATLNKEHPTLKPSLPPGFPKD